MMLMLVPMDAKFIPPLRRKVRLGARLGKIEDEYTDDAPTPESAARGKAEEDRR
jgi:hypothetical protein